MKVIAKVTEKTYICEVDHTELEKFLNLYYGKMKELKIGDSVDLGTGYDWATETKAALKSTETFFKDNTKTIKALTRAFNLDLDA